MLCLHDRLRLKVRIIRIIRELPHDHVASISPQISLARGVVDLTCSRLALLAEQLHGRGISILVVDPDHVDGIAALVAGEVVAGHELHARVSRGEDGVGQVARVWDYQLVLESNRDSTNERVVLTVVHSQVEPDDQVLLLQTLSVKEIVKVYRGVVYVLTVEPVSAFGLGILALCDLEVVLSPMRSIDQITAVLHSQVCQARIWQD